MHAKIEVNLLTHSLGTVIRERSSLAKRALVLRENGGEPVLVDPGKLSSNMLIPQLIAAFGIPIRADQIELWGDFRLADEVRCESDGTILSVNEITDPALFRTRRKFEDGFAPLNAEEASQPTRMQTFGGRDHFPTYPREEIPVDILGSKVMRAWRLYAPIGWGSCLFVGGRFGTGKTLQVTELLRVLLHIAESGEPVEFVIVQMGERGMDIGDELQSLLRDHPKVFIRHIIAADGETMPRTANTLAEIALATVKRRAENPGHRKLVYVIDGLGGLATLGYNLVSSPDSRATKGGITEETILQVTRHVAVAGMGLDGQSSVTVIAAALQGETEGTAAGSIFAQAGGNKSSNTWFNVRMPGSIFPKASLKESTTRKPWAMLSDDRLSIFDQVRARMERIAESRDEGAALEYLWKLAAVSGTWEAAAEKWREMWVKEDERARMKKGEQEYARFTSLAEMLAGLSSSAKSGAMQTAASIMKFDVEAYDLAANAFAGEASKLAEAAAQKIAEETVVREAAEKKLITPSREQYAELAKRLHADGKMSKDFFSKFQIRAFQSVPISLADLEKRIRAGDAPDQIANKIKR